MYMYTDFSKQFIENPIALKHEFLSCYAYNIRIFVFTAPHFYVIYVLVSIKMRIRYLYKQRLSITIN